MTVNLSALPTLITGWIKQGIAIALLLFVALTVLKLFNINLYPVIALGWQEAGVFIAGTAFALNKL